MSTSYPYSLGEDNSVFLFYSKGIALRYAKGITSFSSSMYLLMVCWGSIIGFFFSPPFTCHPPASSSLCFPPTSDIGNIYFGPWNLGGFIFSCFHSSLHLLLSRTGGRLEKGSKSRNGEKKARTRERKKKDIEKCKIMII
jgi:hypothetical protein